MGRGTAGECGATTRDRVRERERQQYCCRIISREYTGSEEKRDKHAAESDGDGEDEGRGGEPVVAWHQSGTKRDEGDESRGEHGGSSWFTCRHGNAASPLTCYSIGIARPSAAVLSQPPQEYERESRSIAWDREPRRRLLSDGRVREYSPRSPARFLSASLPRIDEPSLLSPSFADDTACRAGKKTESRARERETDHRLPHSPLQ